MAEVTLWTHESTTSLADCIVNLDLLPDYDADSQVVEVTLANSSTRSGAGRTYRRGSHVLESKKSFVVSAVPVSAEIKKRTPNLQVSICQDLASALGVNPRSLITVGAVDKRQHGADYVILYFRDQYVSRADMWRLACELDDACVWVGKKVTLGAGIRAEVRQVMIGGKTVFSGWVSQHTKPVFRSESARYLIFLQMSSEMWEFEDDGELFYNKAIDGFLPELFKQWKAIRAHHLVSIILFTRVMYSNVAGAFCLPKGGPIVKSPFDEAEESTEIKDFYKVVVDNVSSDNWESTITELKRELHVFRRDVVLQKTTGLLDTENAIISGTIGPAAQGNLLETVNLAAHQFNRDFVDRDLLRTGTSIIVITAGTGIFDVDEKLLRLTADSLLGNSMGIDIVSLSKRPLHITPVLRYATEHKPYNYIVPFFCEISYFGSGEQLDIIRDNGIFDRRCKMHELRMMGIMEDEMTSIAIDFVTDSPLYHEFKTIDDVDAVANLSDEVAFMTDTCRKALLARTDAKSLKIQQIDPRNLLGTSLPSSPMQTGFKGYYQAARGPIQPSGHSSASSYQSVSPHDMLKMSPVRREEIAVAKNTPRLPPLQSTSDGGARPPLGSRRPTLGRQFSAASSKRLTLKAQPSIAAMNSAVTISSALLQSHMPIVTRGFILPDTDTRATPVVVTPAAAIPTQAAAQREDGRRRMLTPLDISERRVQEVSASFEGRDHGRLSKMKSSATLRSQRRLVTSSEQEDPVPWRVLQNPCYPAKNDTTWNTKAWRWAYISSTSRRTGAVNWESLCSPAAMPLLAYNSVDLSDLESDHWTENSYSIYLDSESISLTIEGLLKEMVAQRLSHGFQIAAVSKPGTVASATIYHCNGLVYLTHDDKEVHCLSCDTNGHTIEVRKYVRKREIPQPIAYRCFIWQIAVEDGYENSQIMLRSMAASHSWNYVDQVISGTERALTESVKYWRARFLLIPMEMSKERRQAHQALSTTGETFTDEEIRLAGINKIVELIHKARDLTPAECRAMSRAGQTIQRTIQPDVTFTTFDPSSYVAHETTPAEAAPPTRSTLSQEVSPIKLRDPGRSDQITEDMPLATIAQEMAGPRGVTIKDRLWHWRWHEGSFVGSEFVSWLIVAAELESREEATRLAQALMDRGLFEHVQRKHGFLDGFYLYRVRTEHATKKKGWFAGSTTSSRKVTPSIPSAPAPPPSPLPQLNERGRASSNVSSSGVLSPVLRPQKPRRRFEMSRQVRIDIDPHKRSYRPEHINVHYDSFHRPGNCFHLRLEWVAVTAKLIDELVQSWSRTAEKYGLTLIEAPVGEAVSVNASNPFRKPLRVKLAVPPPMLRMPNTTAGDQVAAERNSLDAWMTRILQKWDFVLDREADSKYPKGVDLVWTFGASGFRHTQYIHRSGMSICQITPDGFLWLTNRLFVSRHGTHTALPSPVRRTGSIDAAASDQLRNQFLEWCTDADKLSAWYADEAQLLERESVEMVPEMLQTAAQLEAQVASLSGETRATTPLMQPAAQTPTNTHTQGLLTPAGPAPPMTLPSPMPHTATPASGSLRALLDIPRNNQSINHHHGHAADESDRASIDTVALPESLTSGHNSRDSQ